MDEEDETNVPITGCRRKRDVVFRFGSVVVRPLASITLLWELPLPAHRETAAMNGAQHIHKRITSGSQLD